MTRFGRRLRWAWLFKVWPWSVPREVVDFCALPSEMKITPAMHAHANELARRRTGDPGGR